VPFCVFHTHAQMPGIVSAHAGHCPSGVTFI
jgi:hypothetical protein